MTINERKSKRNQNKDLKKIKPKTRKSEKQINKNQTNKKENRRKQRGLR
jgi:hypothetical protein